MIDQARCYIEVFHRAENDQWLFETRDQLTDTLPLHSLTLQIPVNRIYNKVEWEEKTTEDR